jgi:hypothetical protein
VTKLDVDSNLKISHPFDHVDPACSSQDATPDHQRYLRLSVARLNKASPELNADGKRYPDGKSDRVARGLSGI